jgi:hypothetical protein
MGCRRIGVSWLGLLAGVLWVGAATARAQEPVGPSWDAARVPLEQLPYPVGEQVRQVLEHPTYHATGPAESFLCNPQQYLWFLDHPDRAVLAWRRLGAKCVDIQDRGDGRFGWSDDLGSDISWSTVYRDGSMRVWYAEGRVRGGKMLPLLPVRAVVVLRHAALSDQTGQTFVRHQAELALHTDSRTAALVAKLVGASAPQLGQQYVAQLEMFYSALAWYLGQHPREAEYLLSAAAAPRPAPLSYQPQFNPPASLPRPAWGRDDY